MRITYVIDTLASKGGAERIIIEKMNYLASHFGYEVSVICCYQCEGDVNAYPLSDKVSQIYLHVPFYSQYQYPYPYRLWVKRNHLIDYGDKETYRILSPKIHDDIRNMYKDDLISYICLLEKYGKKELDTWGFEERPSKKIGVLKKIWYNLTLKVY